MSKSLHRLTVKQIEAAAPGTALADGGGLLYRATAKGSGKWSFKFVSPDADFRAAQIAKGSKSFQRAMGLGAFPAVLLAAARERAAAARDLLAKGVDPIEDERRRAEETRQRAAAITRAASEQAMTFGRYADHHFLPFALTGFSNPAHIQQWKASFATHAKALRDKALATITREDVLAVLQPIWTTHTVTASRTRQRIERLFAHAIQNGHYRGDNPASWRQFDATLPPPRVEPRHHPAVPHDQIAAFVAAVRAKQPISMAALMLDWITLALCRMSGARCATWAEIDLERNVWEIPAGRMKVRRPHIVPITARMTEILEEAKRRHPAREKGEDPAATDFIFANSKGRPLSEMTALALMRRMDGFKDFTVHGLRSTFRDWAAEMTDYPRELIEEQLAHQLGAVERAYKRGSAHERRRPMMEAWAAICAGETPAEAGNVVPLRTAASGGQA
ncbi:tyrosine-type recombinase/integrase [Tabrizicola sp.]|jgi:integrase|uniref:tyrosine-type recombinase/integrase n=1 Tax=Tabrizicola sp. TaxID=2005166 RepID=UPI0035B23A0C